MDNQYNYYNPNENSNNEDRQRMNSQSEGSQNGEQKGNTPQWQPGGDHLKNRVSCCIILCLFILFSKLHSLFPCLCKSREKRKSQLILYYQLLILFTQSVIPILIFHFNYIICIYTKRVSNHKVEKIRCVPCIMSVWISLFSLPAME